MSAKDTAPDHTMEQTITEALASCVRGVDRVRVGTWILTPNRGRRGAIEAQLSGGWLVCRAPLRDTHIRGVLWRYLLATAQLDGRSKVSIERSHNGRGYTADVREEIPIVDGVDSVDVSGACGQAISNLISAREVLRKTSTGKAVEAPVGAEGVSIGIDDIREVCREAGWSYTERESGQLMLRLDVPNGYYPASLEPRASGCRVLARLSGYESISEGSRHAVATFMLSANAFIRFARGGIEVGEDGTYPFFEVRFSEVPSTAALDHALSALSVACSLCGGELQALADEGVARNFLRVRGGSSQTQTPRTRSKKGGTR